MLGKESALPGTEEALRDLVRGKKKGFCKPLQWVTKLISLNGFQQNITNMLIIILKTIHGE